LIDEIRGESRTRPCDRVAVAGGCKNLTRPSYADAIRAAVGASEGAADQTESEVSVLMCIAHFQLITRAELSFLFRRKIGCCLYRISPSSDPRIRFQAPRNVR
jgi:segregation and condensation protein B